MIGQTPRTPALVPPVSAGRPLLAPPRGVSAFTLYDPNDVADGAPVDDGAGFVEVLLQNAAIASGLPNTGVSLSAPLVDLLGRGGVDSDIYDLLSAVVAWVREDDPPSADLRVGAGLANGPLQTATQGYGVCLTASGTDWMVGHLACPSGTWSATNAAAANALTRGARASARHLASTTQRSISACGLDSSGAEIVAANVASAPGTAAVGDNLTHFFLFAGWVTGTGGAATSVGLTGFECVLRQLQFRRSGRP